MSPEPSACAIANESSEVFLKILKSGNAASELVMEIIYDKKWEICQGINSINLFGK
jgi:hypothetical protein